MKWSRPSLLRWAVSRIWLRMTTLLILLSAISIALFPRPALAACGTLDLGACVDAAEYSFSYGLAGIGWSVDRTLLQLAYQLDQFRAYLAQTAFSAAYQIITNFVSPIYIPVATVALILACLLFMLLPLTGNLNIAKIRHVIIWIVLTPVLVAVGGQLINQAEQIRSQIGSSLFAQAATSAPGAIFGSTASDMPKPQALYPSNPCGSGTLVRRDGAAMHMDDLAAALLYATAQDIHCPDLGGPSQDIPDAFYASPPAYAYDGYVGNLNSEVERRAAVEGMQRGMTRLFQGVLPCLLAVAESLLNLLFSLSLLVLWIGIPLGLMFVYFQQTASGVTGLFRRAVSVLQVSWSSSVVRGLLFSCLLAAARLGNATAYTGFAIGALLLTIYLCLVAGKTLLDSVLTLNTTVQSATGLSVTEPIEVAATSAAVGAVVATGGAAMAVTGLAGSERTKSNSYALSAMAGRIPGMAEVGEVAAAMGWLSTDGALYSGLSAGERSTHSWRSMRVQMERDGARLAPGGDPDRMVAAGSPTATHAQGTPAARAEMAELALDQLGGGAQRLILATDLAEARKDPLLRASALHLNEQQQLVYTERASYSTLDALHAVTVPRGEANMVRLLLDGYQVQENPDEGTVSYWKPRKPATAAADAEGTEAHVSGTPSGGAPTPPAQPAAAANDGIARLEGQIAAVSAQLAGLQSGAGTPTSATNSAAGADQQLEQIAGAIDESRLAVNAEQDELERQVAPAGQSAAAPPFTIVAASRGGPLGGESVTQSGGLTPVPQSLSRNEALLSRLDREIAAAEHSLAQLGQAQDADAQAQRAQLEHTLGRLRTARISVAERVAALKPQASELPSPSEGGSS
jgi:hypothetical protein